MSSPEPKTWTFLTNHAQVLLCVAQDPEIRVRDMAERVGITERATQRILAELVDTGYVKTKRVGRRNSYTVDHEHAMRHTAQLGYEIGTLLEALTDHRPPAAAAVTRPRGTPGRPRRNRGSH
jgi:predicted ArsR family transcriptional regulator